MARSTNLEGEENIAIRTIPACYYCVVSSSNSSLEYALDYFAKTNRPSDYRTAKRNAYISALAREKQKLVPLKQSDFVSGSTGLPNPAW